MDEENRLQPWSVINTEIQSNQKLREKKLKSAQNKNK